MSKCALDIKKDIINNVGNKLTVQGAIVDGNVGYFPNPNRASITIASINREFDNQSVVQEGERGSFTINPPDALVNIYFEQYKREQVAEAEDLQREDIQRGGYTEEDRGEFFQIKSKEVEKASQELDEYLLNFLKPFGVTYKEVEGLKNRLGEDSLGVADVLNKLITLSKDRKIDTVPEEAGHMLVMLMGENHPEIKGLLKSIEKWSGYQEVYDQYFDKYYNEKQIKLEAIGQVIAKGLVREFKESAVDKSIFYQARKAIQAFFKMLSALNPFYSNFYTNHLADKIAKNILLGNTDYVANLTKPNPKLDYSKAVENNPLAKSIIDTFTGSKFGFSLTGSLAISGQGETVFRPEDEPIHDLDFVVNDKSKRGEIDSYLNSINAVPAHYGIKGDDYVTVAYYVPAKNHTVEVVKRSSSGMITDVIVRDASGKQVEPTADKLMAVDFFIYNIPSEERKRGTFTSWQDIYKGKLSLSPLKSGERMFARPKDQRDYVLSVPVSRDVELGQFTYLQTEDMVSSRASEETLELIRAAAKQMGIDIQDLTDYVKAHPEIEADVKNANGVADLIGGVVAVAEGRADRALVEEIVHVATAIIDQVDPKLMTAIISKIDRYKIYKQTLEAYKGKKGYQLSDGKPNIRKIKKEAADKLIAELIINRNEGSTEYPDLLNEETRSWVRRIWEAILDTIRGIYTKSNIDIFETVAGRVATADIAGTTADLTADDIFLQAADNQAVNKFYDTVTSIGKRMRVILEQRDAAGNLIKKRHYKLDETEIPRTVTEKVKEGKAKKFERTELDKIIDDQKREWGNKGHKYVEDYIKNNLIDKDGYRKTIPTTTPIESDLPQAVQEKVRMFADKLIASYPIGTRFIVETKAVNMRTKKLASTLDFIAIEPVGVNDFKVDIYDWKFASIDKTRDDDVPWYKQEEWQEQMGDYANIVYSYGLKPNQLRKARMIPFISNYTNRIKDDPKSGLVLSSIEVGDLDNPKETSLYLLPVAINTESTGNTRVDNLIKSLRQQRDKIFKTAASPEERRSKILQLNEIGKALRSLQMKLDFGPLVNVGTTFVNRAAETFKSFENLDYSKLSEQEIRVKLGELIEYKKSAEKYAELGDVFLDAYEKEDLDEPAKKILDSLEKISASTKRMVDKIEDLQKEFVIQMAIKMKAITADEALGEVTPETKEAYLAAEKEVSGLLNSFTEATRLPSRLINLAARAYLQSKNLMNIKLSRMVNEFEKVLIPLQEEASRAGKSAFDMIGEVRNGQLRLIRKVDPKFYEQVAAAKQARNKKFFMDNMDMEKFNKLAKEEIEKGQKELDLMTFSTDPQKDAIIRKYRVKKLKDSINIHSESFNGFTSFDFNSLFSKTFLEDKHLSSEYKAMSENAKKVWTFFNNLNIRAKDLGYIQKEGLSFFPLMEATFLQKVGQSSDVVGQSRDFFADLFTARVNDLPAHAKIDPETNKVRKEIPRYFTTTDKDVSQLSKDLNKVGTLWIKSILQYENAKSLENVLLTVHSVEESRGHIVVNEKGEVIFEAGAPRVDERSNKSAEVLEKLIDDYIYGIKEDASSFGNMAIDAMVDKVSGTDEEEKQKKAVSTKKALENSNVLVRALAVGLKPLISIANYFGFQFQSFINAGNFYKYRDFLGNHLSVSSGVGLSTIDKGLMDLLVPLNEDITLEKRRQLAKKGSYIDYLSTWTFSDVMMVTNSFPERKLQLTNAKTFNDNSMVVDGEIVNIRKYLAEQDRKTKYKLSAAERRELERSFDERVNTLKETKSLSKVAEVKDGLVVIPGVSDEALARYRTTVIEYARNLNGQLNEDNKAAYTRDTMFKSFMMFKTWVPKQIFVRAADINKNTELDEWEYGRMRLFAKTWAHLGLFRIGKMRAILQGTDEGIQIMNEILEQKRLDYYKKTGQQLEITEEEWYDLVRRELSREMRELGVLFSTLGLVIAAKAAEPPEDATELEKNRYKFWAKAVNKISDEMKFYYNPLSFESITKGSVLPQVGLLSKASNFIWDFSGETRGFIIDDPEIMEKNHPIKYFLNVIPGAAQFQNDVLPFVDPELAKELGVRVTTQGRLY